MLDTSKVPSMDARTRVDYLKDYREFDIEVGVVFRTTCIYRNFSVLDEHNITAPGNAYYDEEARIINDLNIFPGSPLFFARLMEWAFETKRAYKDAYHETVDTELERVLDLCVYELDEFVSAVMKQA